MRKRRRKYSYGFLNSPPLDDETIQQSQRRVARLAPKVRNETDLQPKKKRGNMLRLFESMKG